MANSNTQMSSKGIEVFFSYSHKDEELRDELEKHLSILKHRGLISAWHDRKIGAGEEWNGKIDEQLNSAQIILLLISSDFLASSYCYDIEMKRAMERHNSGEARVIPIILRHAYWEGSPFSKLQALPTNAEPVKDGNWRSIDAAFKDVAEGLEKVINGFNQKIIDSDSSPTPSNNSLKTIIVDQMYRGDFANIIEAVKAADPGDKILVRPGLYEEGLEIDKPLEIVGEGERTDIEIRANGMHTIAFRAATGRVANLTLRQTIGNEFCCVDISRGRLILEECDISSQGKNCISIHNSADPRVRRNKIHNNKGIGVVVTENDQGWLEDNDFFENADSSVEINLGCNLVLKSNRIHDGKSIGVSFGPNSHGILEENDIFGHEKHQVCIAAASNPMLRRNRIHDGKLAGVYFSPNARGILEENDIFGNRGHQVLITNASNPKLRCNRIYDGKSCGVSFYSNALGVLEQNDIFGNEKTQVFIKAGSNPMLRCNLIHNGKSNGVLVYDKGLGIFEDNDIYGHDSPQVAVMKGGNPTFRHNRIRDGKSCGIYILDRGKGVYEQNDLRSNKEGAWYLSENSKSKVKRINNLE